MINLQISIDLAKLPSGTVIHYSFDKINFITFEGENIEYLKDDAPDHIIKLIENQHSDHSHVIDWTKRGKINGST